MQTALVLGAGLAGAALVRSLTRRGVRVHWIDAIGPAAGASALPVGMLSPHVTAQPTPLSLLTDLGAPHTRSELERLLPAGAGWQPSEVDNLGHHPGRHPATLVRPGALVAAWYREADASGRLVAHWPQAVTTLTPTDNGGWSATGRHGPIAEAQTVFVAMAHASSALLSPALDADALPLRPVKGQLSYGALQSEPLAPRPLRQDGVFVPCYEERPPGPLAPARIWAMGSTYTRGVDNTDVIPADHERNAQSLAQLCPAAEQQMRAQLARDELLGWAGVRCASLDRLPLVGRLPDLAATAELLGKPPFHRRKPALHELPRLENLFVLTALGSRGLSLASWCAEVLVAQTLNQPIDLGARAPEAGLWATLDPARFAWRRLRRQSHQPGG